ncbi:MAG: hypothetical protein ACTSU5_22230 [Promethearchaeota archaeon]
MRKFIVKQLVEYRLKSAGEKYQKGVASLAEAATLARVTLYEMMEYVQRENLRPVAPSREDVLLQSELAKKIFSNGAQGESS